jgi:hypothetical protein
MQNVKKIMLCLSSSLLPYFSFSQTTVQYKQYVGAGMVVGNQLPSSLMTGVYGSGGFYFHAFNRISSLDFCAKEMLLFHPQQQATVLTITYRINVLKGFFVGFGGAHGHQILMEDYLEHPVAASMGNHERITHTSGVHADLSYVFKPIITEKKFAVYPYFDLAYTHLFSTVVSWPNLTTNVGLRLGFKRWK